MILLDRRSLLAALSLTLGISSIALAGTVIPTNFNAYGTTTAGYQDYFTGTTFNSGWEEIQSASVFGGGPGSSGSNFTLSGGPAATSYVTVSDTSVSGDPNKLLYNATYDTANQSVLALITVTSNLPTDNTWRGGVATASDATTGQGINGLFTDNSGVAPTLLNDQIAWGNSAGSFTNSVEYWMLLTHDSSNNANITLWPADGVTPQPSTPTVTESAFGARTGIAGLVTDSASGTGTFQVGYFLVQANGLPTITVGAVPEPASCMLLGLGALGLVVFGWRRSRSF